MGNWRRVVYKVWVSLVKGKAQSHLSNKTDAYLLRTCFRWLGDASILATANKWRKERGLPDIPSHLLDRRQEGTA